MKVSVSVAMGLLVTGATMLATPALGQLNPFASPDAMDTMSGAPVGGPGPSFDPVGRAQGAVNATQGGLGGDPFGQPQGDPFGGAPGASPFGAPPGDPFGGGGAGAFNGGGFGQQPGLQGGFTPPVQEATLTAWGGERIFCQRTGVMLQDAREISIRVSDAGMYFDDGQTGGDAVAEDNIYTNIIVSRNHISPEAHAVKTKLVQTLEYAMELSPQDFRLERVATTEPLSPLPKIVDLEQHQDRVLREWAMNFLRDYRLNPDQIDSEFIPTYVPPPPRAPNIPLPASFSPNPAPAGSGQPGFGAGGEGILDGGVTGEPVGAASSRYF